MLLTFEKLMLLNNDIRTQVYFPIHSLNKFTDTPGT